MEEGSYSGIVIPGFIWHRFLDGELTPNDIAILAYLDQNSFKGKGVTQDDLANTLFPLLSLKQDSVSPLVVKLEKLIKLRLVYCQKDEDMSSYYITAWNYDQNRAVLKIYSPTTRTCKYPHSFINYNSKSSFLIE
jgi:hypothetical protein